MTEFDYRPKDGGDPSGRHRIYFTSHPEDFELYFDRVCEDILRTHNAVIYYTRDMTDPAFFEDGEESPLESMALFVVPVTMKLLSLPSRAMDRDIAYAKKNGIPILPFLMESGEELLAAYSKEDKFGKRQFANPKSIDETEIRYRDKLKKYLDSVLISDELAKEIREAFYAQIFLSYRKRDRAQANRLMRLIHDIPGCEDVSIWYDEFLAFGEDWRENIWKAMTDSKLFALLVTPSLLEKDNFVMAEEYTRAKKSKMDILPIKMEKISPDSDAMLKKSLKPNAVISSEDSQFKERFVSALTRAVTRRSECDQRHNFLIGLAYLEGIGVEIDRERAMRLITGAAEAGICEAIEKLVFLYSSGNSRFEDPIREIEWRERLIECYRVSDASRERRIEALGELVSAYFALPSYKSRVDAAMKERYALQCEGLPEGHPDRLAALAELYACDLRVRLSFAPSNMYKTLLDYVSSDSSVADAALFGAIENAVRALLALDDRAAALKLSRAVYDMKCRTLPSDDGEILVSLNGIAELMLEFGEPDALSVKREAYDAYARVYGPRSERALTVAAELGRAYFARREYESARDVLEHAYGTAEKALTEDNPLTLDLFYRLSLVRLALGDIELATAGLCAAYAWRSLYLGSRHEKTLRACIELGRAYHLSGKYEMAVERLEFAVSAVSDLSSFDKERIEDALCDANGTLAECCIALGEYAKAYKYQRSVCEYLDSSDPFCESEETGAATAKLGRIRRLMEENK